MKNTALVTFLLSAFLCAGIGKADAQSTSYQKTRGFWDKEDFFLVNEIQAANIDGVMNPSFNFGGWVELYNPTDHDIALRGIHISDDFNRLKKWPIVAPDTIRAGGFYTLWMGAHNDAPQQVNFSPDADGGVIFFSDAGGELLFQQFYPAAVSRTSYARTTDGGDEWMTCATPTPGRSNAGAAFASVRLDPPVPSVPSGRFSEPFELEVAVPEGAQLRYTTDGTLPTLEGGMACGEGRIHVADSSTVVRMVCFAEGRLPSEVVTRSYLFGGGDFPLPVVSVVTDPRYLYDDEIGIFVRGSNGKPGNGKDYPCNWNRDWNRPANVELLSREGVPLMGMEATVCACGGWSRAGWPKSFKVKAKKKYEGRNFLPYAAFGALPYLRHRTWQIRNGGNDSICRLKDAAVQEIVLSSGIDVEGQRAQPVMHFINGRYAGMLNLREPNNKDYAYAHYGWDEEELDCFQMSPDSAYCQMCGTDSAFLRWYDLSARAADDAVYRFICDSIVDIDEYVNYMAVEMFVGCGDYGPNNIKGFRPRVPGGRFRLVLFDMDSAFGRNDPFTILEKKRMWTYHYDYDTGLQRREEIKLISIFLNMLANPDFRKKFADTFCLVAGSVFEPGRCNAIVDSLAEQRREVLALEGKSPDATAFHLKKSVEKRGPRMVEVLKAYPRMGMEGARGLQVRLASDLEGGKLLVNGLPVPTNRFDGTLFAPVTLQARVPAGYRFAGWMSRRLEEAHTLVRWKGNWNFYDGGSLDGLPWKTDGAGVEWKQGKAPLGFNTKTGNGGLATVLDFGGDAAHKRPAYYFFHDFVLKEKPEAGDLMVLNCRVDDGMVVYVNGREVARHLMPAGSVTYDTFATDFVGVSPASVPVEVPVGLLRKGKNTVAVEVHNCNGPSSDIYFDAELRFKRAVEEVMMEEKEDYVLPDTGKYDLVARFEPLAAGGADDGQAPVVVNELSAGNSVFVNEYFRRNDWIELYNRTDREVDVAGMYLSDERGWPQKCQIADPGDRATVVPPHGRVVVWADNLMPARDLHVNFKLAREGGEVLLTAADGAWADTLTYAAHGGECSVGRYPDGQDPLYVMTVPTLMGPNVINSYALAYEEPDFPLGIGGGVADGELEVRYLAGKLYVDGARASTSVVRVYALTGQCVARQTVVAGTAAVELPGLPCGTYLARVDDASGRRAVVKFIVTGR